MPLNVQDALVSITGALPAGATTTKTAALDLGVNAGTYVTGQHSDFVALVEFGLDVPALAVGAAQQRFDHLRARGQQHRLDLGQSDDADSRAGDPDGRSARRWRRGPGPAVPAALGRHALHRRHGHGIRLGRGRLGQQHDRESILLNGNKKPSGGRQGAGANIGRLRRPRFSSFILLAFPS